VSNTDGQYAGGGSGALIVSGAKDPRIQSARNKCFARPRRNRRLDMEPNQKEEQAKLARTLLIE
jgi:hypothetical protein